MRERRPVYFNAMNVANPLAAKWDEVSNALFQGKSGLSAEVRLNDGRVVPIGQLGFELPLLPETLKDWDSRNNRLAYHSLLPLLSEIEKIMERFGRKRIGVVIGTSTSGISQSEQNLKVRLAMGRWPNQFALMRQELGDPAAFIAEVTGAAGPVYSVSTACTSGAKSLISAARLIQSGLCDAVISGGIDTLCGLTLNGFAALDSVSNAKCNPFSIHRNGINLGEGAALFILSCDPALIRFAGWGESGDGHHLSAPDPEGRGAVLAIKASLKISGIDASQIAYVNLHGTATRFNDAMEALVTHEIFGSDMPCSSTKGLTGHMLGAAGSNEAAFVGMALINGEIPPHIWDGVADPALPVIGLIDQTGEKTSGRYMMSCSYAFGGNNSALVLSRE